LGFSLILERARPAALWGDERAAAFARSERRPRLFDDVLLHLHSQQRRDLLRMFGNSTPRLQIFLGLPELEDVDPLRIDRIGRN
jgi:hypothetical protein